MRILQTRKRLIQIISHIRTHNQQVLDAKNKLINEMHLEIEALQMHGDVMKKKLKDEIEYLEKVAANEEVSYIHDVAEMNVQIRKLREENNELQEYKYRYISFIKNSRIRNKRN